MLPKKWKTEFAAGANYLLSSLSIIEMSTNHNGLEETGSSCEGKFNSEFGPVSFSVYSDWVHFRLDDHPGFVNGSSHWNGFDHWKFNFHTFANQYPGKDRPSVQLCISQLESHIARLKPIKTDTLSIVSP
tara:strand:- start:32239 stop:32628 length:390 start_codon:yes stop_codon:yes gene_type:complete